MDKKILLDYLSMISNKSLVLNLTMHLLIILSIATTYLLKDAKARKYIFNSTLLIIFLSVTLNAIIYGNPFHAITFGIMVIAAVLAIIKDRNPLAIPRRGIRTALSFLFILIGLWYPEFVKTSILESFIVSPVGVIPCPTLITALGMLNLYYPDVNKKQFAVVVFFGVVYGFIGTFKLGVYLDLSLIGIVILSVYNAISHRAVKEERNISI